MCLLYIILWIISARILTICGSSCWMHDKCLLQLRKFTQADEFHIYTSIVEAEVACSAAKDAYLCVTSAPECRVASEKASLSSILRGSARLLNEFCGFKSKRRPCCALRIAYLEHSKCYAGLGDRLNDCNDRYRASLEMILGIEELAEQNEQRYCSLKWFGNCVKRETQDYCGKVAAQIIRSYSMKAGQHHKAFVQKNGLCHDTIYGDEKMNDQFCQQKRFDKCYTHLQFFQGDQMEKKSFDEEFLSVCTAVRDIFQCLGRAFRRCLLSKQTRKLDARMQEVDADIEKNNVCAVSEDFSAYESYVQCVAGRLSQLEQCKSEFGNPAKYTSHTMPFQYYYQYFCASTARFERCLIMAANSGCGYAGRKIMSDIIQMAAVDLHRKCIST